MLRIDPALFEFELLNASAEKGIAKTAKQWGLQKNLNAVINASLYQQDYLTSVSYMRTAGHINNKRLSKDKTLFVFDPTDNTLPMVKIIDRQCDDVELAKKQYRTLIQSIRMISCDGQNVWKPKIQRHSTAAIAIDDAGNVLFIHSRPQLDTFTLVENLQALPLGIARAMYVEGGPQAQLFVRSGDQSHELVGSLAPNLNSEFAWPIPNVIGIRPKP